MKLALEWTSVDKKILGLEATFWSPAEHHNQGLRYNRKVTLNVSSKKHYVRLTVNHVTYFFPKISLHSLRRIFKNISLFLKVNFQHFQDKMCHPVRSTCQVLNVCACVCTCKCLNNFSVASDKNAFKLKRPKGGFFISYNWLQGGCPRSKPYSGTTGLRVSNNVRRLILSLSWGK